MANFQTAFLFTYDHEGGYANNPNDLGGETKYGISKKQYPHLDIKNLKLDDAKLILEHDYWNPLQAVKINCQPLANHLFDMCVNAGIGKAVALLQYSCISCGEDVKIDSIIGPKTLAATNKIAGPWLTDRYRVEQVKHYLRLITVNKSQLPNIYSWLRRASA